MSHGLTWDIAKLHVYTHQNSWCNIWHRVKLLKYDQYKFSSCMNVGVVQDIYGMDKTPLERGQCHYTWRVSCGTSSQLLQKWSYKILRHNSAIFVGSESVFACHKNVFSLGGILRDHNRSHSLDCCTESLVLGRPLFCSSITDYNL